MDFWVLVAVYFGACQSTGPFGFTVCCLAHWLLSCAVFLFLSYMFAGLIISAAPHIHALMYVHHPASHFGDLLTCLVLFLIQPLCYLITCTLYLKYTASGDFSFSEMTRSQCFTKVPLHQAISDLATQQTAEVCKEPPSRPRLDVGS